MTSITAGGIMLAGAALGIGLAIGALLRHASERRGREAFAAHWREELRASGAGRDRAVSDKREIEARLERERETSDDASAGLRRLRKERDAARERASRLDAERDALETRLADTRAELERALHERAEIGTRLDSREASMASTEHAGEEALRRAAALEDEARLLRSELERATADHAGCDERIDELTRQRLAAEREMRELRTTADHVRSADTDRRVAGERAQARERKTWREREATLENELGVARRAAAELRAETERLGRRLSERAAAAATLEAAVALAGDRRASAEDDVSRARGELARLRELVDDRTLALASEPPAWLRSQPDGPPDELSRVRGIGDVIETRLHELGVFRLEQLAGMTDDDRRWLSAHLGVADSRIARERWAEQARSLLAGEHEPRRREST